MSQDFRIITNFIVSGQKTLATGIIFVQHECRVYLHISALDYLKLFICMKYVFRSIWSLRAGEYFCNSTVNQLRSG
jgi:hypothetical protein